MHTSEQDLAIVRSHLSQLMEHFETVQIFATRHEPVEADGTVAVQMGEGNWYARYGHVREWTLKEEERVRAVVRREEDESE